MNTTTENLSVEAKTFYDKTLIKRALPNLVFYKFGQKKSMKNRSGKFISFRKFASLEPAITPLTEGVTPKGKELSVSEITVGVKQYGDYIETTDIVDTVGIDPVVTESAELCGEQAGLTTDNLIRDVVCKGTNVLYVGNRTNTESITSSDKLTSDAVARAVAILKRRNIKPFEGGYYIGIIDPETSYDLQNDKLWQEVSKYNNGGKNIIEGEVGKINKTRFVETTETLVKNGEIESYVATEDETYDSTKTYYTKSGENYSKATITEFASGTTYYEAIYRQVHCVMIIGRDAYGVVDIEGSAKPEIIVKGLGSSGTADPLNQRATVGWKELFGTARINEEAMVRIECATTL